MKNLKIIIALVVVFALVWFVHSINPNISAHQEAIAADMEVDAQVWDDLIYKDYFLVSFTNSTKGSMVSYGLCKFVKVVDEKWIARVSE